MKKFTSMSKRAYACAVFATLIVTGLLFTSGGYLNYHPSALPLLLPVLIASVLGGVRPGLLATALAAAVYAVIFGSAPWRTYSRALTSDVRVWSLVFEGVLISLFGGALRQARHSARVAMDRESDLEAEIRERQRIEVALREAEQSCDRQFKELEAVYATAPIGLCFVDSDLRYVRVNQQMAEMNGLPIGEHLGRPVAEVLPFLADSIVPVLQKVITSGEPVLDVEITGAATDRSAVQQSRLTSFVPIKNNDGTVWGVNISVKDITERKKFEGALQESEERYRLLTEVSPQFVWMTDSDGKVTYANRHWVDYSGVSLEETFGNGWESVLHPDDHSRTLAVYEKALRTGTAYEMELRLKHGTTHQYRWHLARALPLRGDSGQIKQWIGICMDIHDLKSAEEKLRDSVRLYHAIGESIDYGVWICAPDGRNTYLSESFIRLVGLTPEESANFGWQDVLPPEEVDLFLSAWQQCVRGDSAFWDREIKVKGADGSWHYILSRGVPVKNDRGELVCWAGINLDIDRLKKAEQALRDLDRRKDTFFAMLAHELRNPLTPILTVAQMLKRSPKPDGETVSWAGDTIEKQVKNLTRLVNDLLDVSRIARGKVKLQKEHADLNAIVSLAVETCRPSIEQRNQQLKVSLPQEPIWIFGDSARLSQVLQNLLLNASKFTPVEGRIEISAQRQESDALVSVRDNGIGIRKEDLGEIFKPFTQARYPEGVAQAGLGIGLALANSFVQLHGGEIKAASAGEGNGSEFIVRLPAQAKALEAGALQPESPALSQHEKKRVLLVDDNPSVLEALTRFLQDNKYEVIASNKGLPAVTLARQSRPSAAIVDIGLPDIDGYEVARRLRADAELEKILLIAMTGYGTAKDERYAQEQGFDRFLNKPLDTNAILSLLANT
jgi:PAS domain S-box-containing protein